METNSCEKVALKFNCLLCHYKTGRKSSYDKHIETSKHNLNTKKTKSCGR
jgi:hypothetical protein